VVPLLLRAAAHAEDVCALGSRLESPEQRAVSEHQCASERSPAFNEQKNVGWRSPFCQRTPPPALSALLFIRRRANFLCISGGRVLFNVAHQKPKCQSLFFSFFSHFEHQTCEKCINLRITHRVWQVLRCAPGISLETRFFYVFFVRWLYMGVGCVCVHAAQQLMI